MWVTSPCVEACERSGAWIRSPDQRQIATSSVCEHHGRQTLCWPCDSVAGRGAAAHRPVPFSVVLKVILAPVAEDTPRMKAFT